jgi:DEAD/DEAH box helicase domain-containing protein
VIILYPMNALATDQAKRLAEAIWNDNRLKGRVTAGLFIGEGRDRKHFETRMGETHIIENRTSIIEQPPDILLTNFKMLDYALMRRSPIRQYLCFYDVMFIINLATFVIC